MKRWLILSFTLLAVFFWSASLFAGQLTLAWDPNTETDLAGYKLYYGTAPGTYGAPIDVGNRDNFTITNLAEGITYYFSITAYNSTGLESGYSNEISYSIVPTVIVDDGTGALGWTRVSGSGSMLPVLDEGDYALYFSSTGPTALTAYRISLAGIDPAFDTVSWNLKMLLVSNSFFLINVSTTLGARNMYYRFLDTSALGTSTNIFYGIGTALKDGQWHNVIRNLQNDLKLAQPTNNLLRINYFYVYAYGLGGAMAVDDLLLYSQ